LPHSEICGSTLLGSSPQLIAALHVLLRRSMPRHPPCALCNLAYRTWTAPALRTAQGLSHNNMGSYLPCFLQFYFLLRFPIRQRTFLVWLTAERTADPGTGRGLAIPNKYGMPMILAVELRGFEPRTPCLQSRCSSQLSYSPGVFPNVRAPVGLGGVEPPTSRLSGVRSNHLSYKPSPVRKFAGRSSRSSVCSLAA
jgi:hypothetical protein